MTQQTPILKIDRLFHYPLKSARGYDVFSSSVMHDGLKGDRRMMLVDEKGVCLTARNTPKLMQINCSYDRNEIIFHGDTGTPLVIDLDALSSESADSTLWGKELKTTDGGDEAAQWFSAFTEKKCRITIQSNKTQRPSPFGKEREVNLSDTAPVMLMNSASLAHLNQFLETQAAVEQFRPNILISGEQPFAEDTWDHIRIGEVEFKAVGACDRCVMITLDPKTGEAKKPGEPFATLSKYRRGLDNKTYMGQFLMPVTSGRIYTGDKISVLSRKSPPEMHPSPDLYKSADVPARAVQHQTQKNHFTCTEIINETHDVKTFMFALPLDVKFDHHPGQFMTVAPVIEGQEVKRNYTISSSPSRPHHIAITVKRKPDGYVSHWLHDHLNKGNALKISGPFGHFYLPPTPPQKILMLSAGSGITPMISMLRHIADTNQQADVIFHHSVNCEEDMIYRRELDLLALQLGDRLKLFWNFSNLPENITSPQFIEGWINKGVIEKICPDIKEYTLFCCGPDGYRDICRDAHAALCPNAAFPFLEESFGAAPSGQVDKDIPYHVTFTKSKSEAQGEQATSLLTLIRDADIELQSDCEAGICGSCKCQITSGDWEIAPHCADPERTALTDDEKDSGYVLACTTYPVGDVKVDI